MQTERAEAFFLCERRRRRRIPSAMREQLKNTAASVGNRAEAFFLCERPRRRRIPSAMREQV
jgi:hypothetical protein